MEADECEVHCPKSRKERRKEERLLKKRKRAPPSHTTTTTTTNVTNMSSSPQSNNKNEKRQSQPFRKQKNNQSTPSNNKGTDVVQSVATINKNGKAQDYMKKKGKNQDPYAHLDAETAAAMRRDDEEIADLQAKLLSDSQGKQRLHREFAKMEGYGDDFGDFLDELDTIVYRVVTGENDGNEQLNDDMQKIVHTSIGDDDDVDFSSSDSDVDEEVVPMKDPAMDSYDESDSVLDEIEAENGDGTTTSTSPTGSRKANDESDSTREVTIEDDHDPSLTYRPTTGEDIYGNKRGAAKEDTSSKAYLPPHLRKRSINGGEEAMQQQVERDRQESLHAIKRSLNSALNRLSEDTLISVSQSLAKLYLIYPTTDVNACLWTNMQNACIDRGHQMVGLIPVYVAAMAGVHLTRGDSAQLGEFLCENIVKALWEEISNARQTGKIDADEDVEEIEVAINKKACNQMLVLCYMYNFGVVHCSLLYDIIRNMIASLEEIDIELLLLILSHCGRALRSDDPLALKDIVLLVQKTHMEKAQTSVAMSSRADYMVAAMQDLKNNKRRKQDQAYTDTTTKLRKLLGQIKSSISASNKNVRSSDSSLRISLQDILEVESKGRWWKVGASWVGNQYHGTKESTGNTNNHELTNVKDSDKKLLQLAAKYRMNTDTKRAIFCIIMGCADYEDCFEKLVRAGYLKNQRERESVRVLVECCGNEDTYNKFYSHLAGRLCEYQVQCKFTFQLAFWDAFKQFDEMKPRKAANLAKLLFHLVAVSNALKLNVIKTIDMASPENLPEAATIFLTIFLSSILEHCDSVVDIYRLFGRGGNDRQDNSNDTDVSIGDLSESEAFRASLLVFLVKVMKASPKYSKRSLYKVNLKVAINSCNKDVVF